MREMKKHVDPVTAAYTSLKSAVAGLGATIAAALSVRAISNFARTAVNEFAELERVQFRLQKQIELVGASWASWDGINEIARDIGRATLASADEVRQAASLFMVSGNATQENFRRTLMVAQDLAEVVGMNLPTAMRYLSRATTDVTGAMAMFRRYGININQTTEDIIKSLSDAGKEAEAFDLLLSNLEQRIGGTALEAAKGLAGSFDNVTQATKQLRESIGEELAPTVKEITDSYVAWIDANEK
jgi:hypothetical protein